MKYTRFEELPVWQAAQELSHGVFAEFERRLVFEPVPANEDCVGGGRVGHLSGSDGAHVEDVGCEGRAELAGYFGRSDGA